MDTSKEYIEMCENAKEIYTGTLPNYSFYIKFTEGDDIKIKLPGDNIENGVTWLPRQDQLQDMVELSGHLPRTKISYFYKKLEDNYYQFFFSMEKLWLTFVMKEKYNKKWNGVDWELEK